MTCRPAVSVAEHARPTDRRSVRQMSYQQVVLPAPSSCAFGPIDHIADRLFRLTFRDLLDLVHPESVRPRMPDIESLVEAYLIAERDLVAAVDAAGGALPLPDGRTVTVGRAEFDALLSGRCKRAWVTIRKSAPMPPRR